MARSSIAAERADETGTRSGRPSPRLVLASEALREDVAPFEPGGRAGRRVVLGVAVALAWLALAVRPGAATGSSIESSLAFAAAGATAALAWLPFSYAVRARAIAALGCALLLSGAFAAGPLAGLRLDSTLGAALGRVLAVGALPGALLFRARYRAYPRARHVLGVALLVAAPFALSQALVVLNSGADVTARAAAAVDVAVILSGLFGFMGADTTGGGAVWAALVLGVLSTDVALRDIDTALGLSHWFGHAQAAIGTACAAALSAIGEYHLLATSLAEDARRVARSVSGTGAGTGSPGASPGRS